MRSTLLDNLAARLELAEGLFLGLDTTSRLLLEAAFEAELDGIVELAQAAGDDEADGRATLRIRAMSRAVRWLAPTEGLDPLAAVLVDASRDADRLDAETELLFDDLYLDALSDTEIGILGALAQAALRLETVDVDFLTALLASHGA